MVGEEVSSEYLVGENLARYSKIESKIKAELSKVFSSIKEPTKLPYIPVVYVISWVPMKELRSGSTIARLYHYNLIFVDPKNFERYAIFSTLNFLDRFQDYIGGGLGHEVAHIIQVKGKIEVELLQIFQYIKDPIQAEGKKEVDAKEFYELFNEPVQSTIRKWNELSKYQEIMDEVAYDAEIVNMKRFCELIFGDKEQQFEHHMTQMIAEGLRKNGLRK